MHVFCWNQFHIFSESGNGTRGHGVIGLEPVRGVCLDTLGQCTIKNDNTTNLTGSHDKFVSEREREGEGGR